MSTSTPPNQSLNPPLEVRPVSSRNSNSSAHGNKDYFSYGDQEAIPIRQDHLPESPLPVPALSASIVFSAHSEYESNYSNESNYLTPPQGNEDYEKPPYKAHSESSASLNMFTSNLDNATKSAHRSTTKKQDSKHEHATVVDNDREHKQILTEQKFLSRQSIPGSGRTRSMNIKHDNDSEAFGSLLRWCVVHKLTIRECDKSLKDYTFGLISTAAASVTCRRWSSVGLGADEASRSNPAAADNMDPQITRVNRKRGNSLTKFTSNEEIMKLVRAKLTVHEVPTNYPPTPATITLRRASRTAVGSNGAQSIRGNNDLKLHNTKAPLSTYLITTSDIDFIANLIKSGFDVRKTTTDVPDRNIEVDRKPSVTAHGLLPTSSGAADLAITTEDIHQTLRFPPDSFKDTQTAISIPVGDGIRRSSRAASNRETPEVIWEDNRKLAGSYSPSKVTSSSDGTSDVIEGPGTTNFSGKLSSNSVEACSPRTDTLGYRQRESSNHGDKSPTSRVFQWVFKEPSDDVVESSYPDSEDSAPDGEPESPKEPSKKSSGPSRAIFCPDVISFPPLLPRQLTTDWFSPLPNISELSSGDDKCLYDAGIDAQLGSGVKNLHESLIRAKEQSMPSEKIQHPRKFPGLGLESSSRRKSMTVLHPQVSPRLGDSLKIGNALGCSSGARRKSSARSVRLRIADDDLEHRSQNLGASWVKPRKDSGWPAPRSPSPDELHSRKVSHTLVPLLGQAASQSGKWLNKLGQMQPNFMTSSSPLLAETDHTGTYAALTGAKNSTLACEPDCQRERGRGKKAFESRNPSTDWIG